MGVFVADVVAADVLEEVLARVELENDEFADEVGTDEAVDASVLAGSELQGVPAERFSNDKTAGKRSTNLWEAVVRQRTRFQL